MSALAEIKRGEVIPQDADSIMAVISRAAADPNTDVDKLERLLGMYERLQARSARAAYMEALAEMQPKLPVIEKRGQIKINESKPGQKYALWEDINDAIKPILAEHGFALSFRTGQEESKIMVTGVLSHRAGHSEQTTMYLPSDTSGSKNAVQAVGSSTSYGKRYTAQALLNLTSRGEDDDGGKADPRGFISEAQAKQIEALLKTTGTDVAKFCTWMKVAFVADIMARDFPKAVTALKAKQKGAGK